MEPVPIDFVSGGDCLHGKFFPAAGSGPAATLLLVPGWPGNPDDVLSLGALLSPQGVNVCMFNLRGTYGSEGVWGLANTLEDIGAAWSLLNRADMQARFGFDAAGLALGGYSYGGGMALAYAAQDPGVRRVVSVAGNDHAAFVRELSRNSELATRFQGFLLSALAPQGPVRFDPDVVLQEFRERQDVYGLQENAEKLADRSILLIGGWEDTDIRVEQVLVPFYRALKRAGAADVTFLVYHAGHDFSTARGQLAAGIRDWLQREGP